MLRDAGIDVTENVLRKEAEELNKGFFLRVTQNRPLVTLEDRAKPRWLHRHRLGRKQMDHRRGGARLRPSAARQARRHPDRHRNRARRRSRTHLPHSRASKTARPSAWCSTRACAFRPSRSSRKPRGKSPPSFSPRPKAASALEAAGVEIIRVAPDAQSRPDISACLNALAARGITRLLVEGGATVHAAFLDRGLADRLEIFTAPASTGGGGTRRHRGAGRTHAERIPTI